jgi:hypothetical protein
MQPQPITSQPRDPRAWNSVKHGLTGQILLATPAEHAAYESHSRGIRESLAPEGEMESGLVQSIADDRWRLMRAATLESAIFAEGAAKSLESEDSTGDPKIDAALAQGRTWLAEARNLNLLTLYESRIQRRFEKNMAELRKLQSERKAALQQAIEEAARLAQLAESEGQTYNLSEAFECRNFAFSTEEIGRMVSRYRRLQRAKKLSAAPRKGLSVAA